MTNELNMTVEQMIEEIKFTREWEQYLLSKIPDEYAFFANAFVREKSRNTLIEAGIPAEEVDKCIEEIERDFISEQ